MEPIFELTLSEAGVVFHALRYYASDAVEAFVEDDDSPLLDEAASAEDLARRLQAWMVANHQTLLRDPPR